MLLGDGAAIGPDQTAQHDGCERDVVQVACRTNESFWDEVDRADEVGDSRGQESLAACGHPCVQGQSAHQVQEIGACQQELGVLDGGPFGVDQSVNFAS